MDHSLNGKDEVGIPVLSDAFCNLSAVVEGEDGNCAWVRVGAGRPDDMPRGGISSEVMPSGGFSVGGSRRRDDRRCLLRSVDAGISADARLKLDYLAIHMHATCRCWCLAMPGISMVVHTEEAVFGRTHAGWAIWAGLGWAIGMGGK